MPREMLYLQREVGNSCPGRGPKEGNVLFNDWCNKGRGMCHPVCGMIYKRTLAANRKE